MDRRIFQQFIVDNFKITESIILDRFHRAFLKSSVWALLTPITRIFKYFDGQHQQPGSQSDGDISNNIISKEEWITGFATFIKGRLCCHHHHCHQHHYWKTGLVIFTEANPVNRRKERYRAQIPLFLVFLAIPVWVFLYYNIKIQV